MKTQDVKYLSLKSRHEAAVSTDRRWDWARHGIVHCCAQPPAAATSCRYCCCRKLRS
jgi:hypothetical protein